MGKLIDNRYRVIQRIGRGGMGSVDLAEDTRLDRQVAIKRLQLIAHADDLDIFYKRFEREAKVMAGFQHPNIVSVFDYGQDEEGVYLVLEYMPGGSLADEMRKRQFSIEEAIKILLPLMEALQAIHQQGNVHRDLKPANILFDKYGNPKLADFGVVKLLQGQDMTFTPTGAAVGTPAYMAPELIGGEASPATDQYALGVMLYELATGKKPFKGRTPMETLTMQKYEPLPDPRSINPELPEWICAVICKALAKDAKDRYADIKQFAKVLKTGEPVEDRTVLAAPESEEDETGLVAMNTEPELTAVKDTMDKPVVAEQLQSFNPQPESFKTTDRTVLPTGVVHPEDVKASSGSQQLIRESQKQSQPVQRPVIENKTRDLINSAGKNNNKQQQKNPFPRWIILVGIVVVLIGAGIILFTSNVYFTWRTERAYKNVTASASAQNPPACIEIGQEWTNPVNGQTMVCVPEGTFPMGSENEDEDEYPVHEVYLDSYWIDKTEITNNQYRQCVDDGVCISPNGKSAYNYYQYRSHPIDVINWYQAQAYCQWVGGSLPTEAQWEKAARGTGARTYPWGETSPNCNLANYSGCEGDTSAVGSYPDGASPYGALDMAGNVWEWVADWYDNGYYEVSPVKNPTGPVNGMSRVLRGGSNYHSEIEIRAANRFEPDPAHFSAYRGGFRCVYAADQTATVVEGGIDSTSIPMNDSALDSGSKMTREKDGMEMVYVPAGTFTMGNEDGDSDERPVHDVYLDAYWIDKYEVTNAQFGAFIKDSNYVTDAEIIGSSFVFSNGTFAMMEGAGWAHPQGPNSDIDGIQSLPVVHVSWNDAIAYCAWAGGSLPTEAQWEKAARGTDGRMYPWGNQSPNGHFTNFADQNLAVKWADNNVDDGYETTAQVGSYPAGASPYGALDMAGNVWEWVADWYDYGYYTNSAAENPLGPNIGEYRGLRGGSFDTNGNFLRAAIRNWSAPDAGWYSLGFRCAFPTDQTTTEIVEKVETTPTPISNSSPKIEGTPDIGSMMLREKDNMHMVYVPSSTFTMGREYGDDFDNPMHEVFLDSYWIDQYEVTNTQYALCVMDGSCTAPNSVESFTRKSYYNNEEYADYPVIYVNWHQAEAYCAWAGGSLPTEAQWEKAARGTDARDFPWGNNFDRCIYANDYSSCVGDTTNIGSYPEGISPYGAYDMAGNVSEWVADWYDYSYYDNTPEDNPEGPVTGTDRGLRGGSWFDKYIVFMADRDSLNPLSRRISVGFRCVFTP